jgi:hypothetical protein
MLPEILFFIGYNFGYTQPTHSHHTYTRVRVCTHAKKILGATCAGNAQYHQMRACTYTLKFLEKIQKKVQSPGFEPRPTGQPYNWTTRPFAYAALDSTSCKPPHQM